MSAELQTMTSPTAPQEGATPRVDKFYADSKVYSISERVGLYELARTLETELAAANARLLALQARVEAGVPKERVQVVDPLVIMLAEDGKIVCHLHRRQDDTYKGYALMAYDLVRHIANAFQVDEDDVWHWVEKERHHHTTNITRSS